MTTDRDGTRRTDDTHATKTRLRALTLAITLLSLYGLTGPALPARADELVVNGRFDDDLVGWKTFHDAQRQADWAAADAAGSSSSGSAKLTNTEMQAAIVNTPMVQCVPVQAGEDYRAAAKIRVEPGQARTGMAALYLIWFSNTDCFGNTLRSDSVGAATSPGGWTPIHLDTTSPAGAVAVQLRTYVTKHQAGGTFSADFDDVSLLPADEAPPSDECGSVPGPDLTDHDFPGFHFRVEIVNGGGSLSAASESHCLPETLCVSGALPGRTEAELRLIGPRPNGHLWLQVVRFTPSELRIEVEKVAGGTCKRYTLPAIPPGSDTLDGFVDRTAFVP